MYKVLTLMILIGCVTEETIINQTYPAHYTRFTPEVHTYVHEYDSHATLFGAPTKGSINE